MLLQYKLENKTLSSIQYKQKLMFRLQHKQVDTVMAIWAQISGKKLMKSVYILERCTLKLQVGKFDYIDFFFTRVNFLLLLEEFIYKVLFMYDGPLMLSGPWIYPKVLYLLLLCFHIKLYSHVCHFKNQQVILFSFIISSR